MQEAEVVGSCTFLKVKARQQWTAELSQTRQLCLPLQWWRAGQSVGTPSSHASGCPSFTSLTSESAVEFWGPFFA